MNDVYILGGAQTDFERNWSKEGKNVFALLKEVTDDALNNVKISKKRQKNAMKKLRQAYVSMREAHKHLEKMKEYQHEADLAEREAINTLVKLKYLS